jgi:cobalt-zinc-cadmium efflux system protein
MLSLEHKMNAPNRLLLSIGITLILFLGEVIGGIVSNSLALLSDAGHVLTDALALSVSLAALYIMHKPSNHHATFGYHRIGLAAAVFNGGSLLIIAGFIFVEAWHRLLSPEPIAGGIMLGVALAGLIGNLAMAFIIGQAHHDLNLKSAWLHVLGDALSSIGVIAASIVIQLTGWTLVDPLVSIIVGFIIVIGGFRLVKQSLHIFFEFSPADIHTEDIINDIAALPGVVDIHDVHLWSISHGMPSFSAHVCVSQTDMKMVDHLRNQIESVLARYGIHHSALQMSNMCCRENGADIYCNQKSTYQEPHHHSH